MYTVEPTVHACMSLLGWGMGVIAAHPSRSSAGRPATFTHTTNRQMAMVRVEREEKVRMVGRNAIVWYREGTVWCVQECVCPSVSGFACLWACASLGLQLRSKSRFSMPVHGTVTTTQNKTHHKDYLHREAGPVSQVQCVER